MEQGLDKRLLNVLKKAVQSERVAFRRYTLSESIAKSDEEKKIFKSLAEDELKHEEILMGRIRELKKAIGLEVMKKEGKKDEPAKKSKRAKKKEEKKAEKDKEPKVEKEEEPKAEKKPEKKEESKAEPKAEKKSEKKEEPKAEPKAEKKPEKKEEPKAEPKEEKKE